MSANTSYWNTNSPSSIISVSDNRRNLESLELENAFFILRSALNSLSLAIESLNNPVLTVSESARKYLRPDQTRSLDISFLARSSVLKAHLDKIRQQFVRRPSASDNNISISIEKLRAFEIGVQQLREHYFQKEQVFDYYVDLLHTRSENSMGPLLKGCDTIAYASLSLGLQKLGHPIPTVVCYLDRGEGASILKAGIYLWDGQTNAAAVIKVVRSAMATPRLSSILHECGHQAAHILDWNRQLATLLWTTILNGGGSQSLAYLWASWASEIAADFWAFHQSNFASVIGLSEVVAGNPNRVFQIIPGDPHPMGYLRVLLGLSACKMAFGKGPWDDYARVWQNVLYPLHAAKAESARIVTESIPLLPIICKAISKTKMSAFSGKSLEDILPWNFASTSRVRSFLNYDLSQFSVNSDKLVENPILTLTAFRYMQMFGGSRAQQQITKQMRSWLISLADINGSSAISSSVKGGVNNSS
jgi:hypothetical protein